MGDPAKCISAARELERIDGLIRDFQAMIDPDRPQDTDKAWQESVDDLLEKRFLITNKKVE